MSATPYNPEIHHRRSIRLKGHDYAGGGLYFVTLCAHREFIRFAQGNPFGGVGARPASPVRELIEERMRITAEKCPFIKWEEAVIMPDHMHALIRMDGGHQRLGDVIGGFKAAVSREIRRGKARLAPSCPPRNIRIWHRNYYEAIVRTPEAAGKIAEYIRMNPWKNIVHLSDGMRGIGNPSLLNREKTGMLCSRNCPEETLMGAKARASNAKATHCIISGFHSPPEQALLASLLKTRARIICCPAWGIDAMKIPDGWRLALEQNRMLILEMQKDDGDLAAAEQRNRFVLEQADNLWLPYINPGGMLDHLVHFDL